MNNNKKKNFLNFKKNFGLPFNSFSSKLLLMFAEILNNPRKKKKRIFFIIFFSQSWYKYLYVYTRVCIFIVREFKRTNLAFPVFVRDVIISLHQCFCYLCSPYIVQYFLYEHLHKATVCIYFRTYWNNKTGVVQFLLPFYEWQNVQLNQLDERIKFFIVYVHLKLSIIKEYILR